MYGEFFCVANFSATTSRGHENHTTSAKMLNINELPTSMASNDEEWLNNSIKDGSIRSYSFDDFLDRLPIGHGGYGVVSRAKAKTLGIMIAYKLLYSQNDCDDMSKFKDFVREVGKL